MKFLKINWIKIIILLIIGGLSFYIYNLQSDIDKLETELNYCDEEKMDLVSQNEELQSQIYELESELENCQSNLNDSESNNSDIQYELQNTQNRLENSENSNYR